MLTKTITEISIKNNEAIENLNGKVLELMNDKGLVAPYIASSLVSKPLFKPKNESQFRLMKDLNSTKVYDFLIHGNIPVTLYSNMSTFGDSRKPFKLDGDLFKTMTSFKFNVGHSNLHDREIIYEFAKAIKFDIKSIGRKLPELYILLSCLNHAQWLREIQQCFYHAIVTSCVID